MTKLLKNTLDVAMLLAGVTAIIGVHSYLVLS